MQCYALLPVGPAFKSTEFISKIREDVYIFGIVAREHASFIAVLLGITNQEYTDHLEYTKKKSVKILALSFWRRNYFFLNFSTPCI